MDFRTPVAQLSRVGKTAAKNLGKLGIYTARDLLYYFPFRYEDYRRVVPIAEVREGDMVTICGQVELVASKRSFKTKKIITEALVSDASGSMRIVWFNQPFIVKNISSGDVLYFSGKVKQDMLGPQMQAPLYEKQKKDTTHTARLVPIYPLTHGITQKQIRSLVSQVIGLAEKMADWLPPQILEQEDLVPLGNALYGVHFPVDEKDLGASTNRLKFDELFIVQMQAELARAERSALQAPALIFQEAKIKAFVSSLPFALTHAQKIAAWEILQDVQKQTPMNRLLSGDVGSGKTVVAAIAAYSAFLNNRQAIIMAPTEILAQQHYQSLVRLLTGMGVSVGLLTANQHMRSDIMENTTKKSLSADIGSGSLHVVVGTHALLSDQVVFNSTGLVVVDEQHRFGVEQRKLIKDKTVNLAAHTSAHFLSMTATPIPRSLALVIYGDLDISVINEMPAGRKKIITKIVDAHNRNKAYQFIREQIAQGRQAFVICPLIASQDDPVFVLQAAADDKKTVMSEFEKLSKNIFPDLRVGYVHGKLKSAEKDAAMAKFKAGEIDILVSTSVVEVGVDIPNASVMVIEGAQQFGLAQLHQFRGRVGRSSHQSYCFLFSETQSADTKKRLEFFEKVHDGFTLAEKDLEMRGPGEVYGVEQSGEMQLRLAKITDIALVKKAQHAARLIAQDLGKYPRVVARVRAWEQKTHLE
jgi:ATP-dependent DNA helicase RecG